MAVTPERTPGAFGSAPAGAPHEFAQPEDPSAHAARVRMAQQNERELKPLVFAPPTGSIVQPAARPSGKGASSPGAPGLTPSPAVTIVAPTQSRLRMPGAVKPSIAILAESVAAPAPKIILTDAPAPGTPTGVQSTPTPAVVAPAQTQQAPIERPAVDPATAAHLASPLAQAARKLQEQRQLTHQPAASATDSPSRGIPTPSADPGKQITGGFGDAGDAQYFPMDGSELRELVRGLMSVIDEQLNNDLRFSMALVYPRVAARVIVEVTAYAAGGDGGQYDPSFAITKVMPPHEKTPIEVAKQRADQCVFVVVAERVEMSATGESIAPPNQIREELGLAVPRKQAVQTPTGRMIVDLRA